jgi:hypothetical protein
MIGITLRVAMSDVDVVEVDVTPRAAVDFERHFKIGFLRAFAQNQLLEHVYYLGWDCLRLSGRAVKSFEEWLDDVATVEVVLSDEAAPDPLG